MTAPSHRHATALFNAILYPHARSRSLRVTALAIDIARAPFAQSAAIVWPLAWLPGKMIHTDFITMGYLVTART